MGILSNASLVYLPDIVRFSIAYIACIVLPGYALAVLARPRAPRSERLIFAIPCAYGLVTVTGLATALLHLSYGLAAYALLAAPITLAAGVVSWRRRGSTDESSDRWWTIPFVAALLYLGTVIVIYARETVPAGYDVLAHVTWITQIMRAHVYPIALLSQHIGDTSGGFYPPTYHVVTGLVLNLAPMPVYRAAFLSVTAVVAILPIALFTYVRIATNSRRLAGLAVVASLAFEPLPLFTQGLGLWPFVVSLLIVPATAIALRDGMVLGDRRARGLAGLLGIGLFYTHPTEFATVGLLVLALLPGLLRKAKDWRRACGYGLAIGAVWIVAALPALMAVHRTIFVNAHDEIASTHDFTPSVHASLGAGLNFYVQWVFGRNIGYVLLAAVLVGAAWCVAKRRWLGLVAAQAVLAVLFVDSVSYDILRPLYVASFPWALWERMAPTHYWLALPLAAIGIDAIWPCVRQFARTKATPFVAIYSTPLVVLGLLLPFGVTGALVANYAHTRAVVAPADLNALAWLAHHAPRNTVVANDGDTAHMATFDAPIDAGRWMPVLGGPQPLFWRGGTGPGSITERYYVLRHIADDPLPPRVAQYVTRYNVRYVFYGAQARPGATRHLDLNRLLRSRNLRIVYAATPGCKDEQPILARCRAAAPIIFALNEPPR